MAQLVRRLLNQPLQEQLLAPRQAVEFLLQPRGGYHGAIPVELRLAEDEGQQVGSGVVADGAACHARLSRGVGPFGPR